VNFRKKRQTIYSPLFDINGKTLPSDKKLPEKEKKEEITLIIDYGRGKMVYKRERFTDVLLNGHYMGYVCGYLPAA